MIDWRLYRVAFAPAIVAVIVILFSLEPVPEPLEAPVTLGAFDGDAAGQTANEIVTEAPDRPPGSSGDAEIAELVEQRFAEIESAEVSEQSFSSSFEGDDVELRNVIATLPGESERRVVVLASRDTPSGAGAVSSAAATAVLLDLARRFGDATHSKTLVFVSTAGGADGAVGAREFADNYPERDLIDAAVVVAQPGARQPEPPLVVPWSVGQHSTAIQLTVTAAAIVSAEVGAPAELDGTLGELMRLALPTGLGEQAPLIEEGVDAVAVSSTGERPPAPANDDLDALSEETLDEFGQATQTIVLALDAGPSTLEHGPSAYVSLGDNLVPGWSIALLAFTLLLPAGVAAADGFARALRREAVRPLELGWVLGRSLPFVALLVLTYLLSLSGILSSPRFPYDPGRFGIDLQAAVVITLLVATLGLVWIATRPLSVPRRGDPQGLATAAGVVSVVVSLALWLINPYLALLAVPSAHAWLAATISSPAARRPGSIAALTISLVPVLVALIVLGDRLEVAGTVPWHVLLMVAGRQVGPVTALLGCLLAGCLTSLLAAGLGRSRPTREPGISVRGPSPRPQDGTEPSGDRATPSERGSGPGRIFDRQRLTERAPEAD